MFELFKRCNTCRQVSRVLVELCLKFDVQSFEAKNRVFELDYQKMNTFEFVQCSKNRCSILFDKQFTKSSEGPIRFEVRSFEAKNRVFEFDNQ